MLDSSCTLARRSLAAALLVALGVLTARCSGPAGETAPAGAPPRAGAATLTSLLPENGAVAGWTRIADVKRYTADNLWEFINGGADAYLAFGFQEVVTSEYEHAGMPSTLIADIYRMASPRQAFGIYAQEASPAGDFRPIGAEGYLAGTALNFWHGPYYVKLTTFQEHDALKREMARMAEAVSRKLGEAGEPPAEVKYFPAEGLVPHSIRLVPRRVLGQDYLPEGFEARYRPKGEEHSLFLVAFGDAPQAEGARQRYMNDLVAGGGVEALPNGEVIGKDAQYGRVLVKHSGRHLAIATGAWSEAAALPLMRALLENAGREH